MAAFAVAAAASVAACAGGSQASVEAARPDAPYGDWGISFPTSATGEAQAAFVRGMTAMHLFMYPDAVKEFQAAQSANAGFAMAYWGEALSHYRPIWREYERDEARAVLQRLGATPEARAAKAPTPREKAYLASLDVLYADGPPAERMRAYSESLQKLTESFPEDEEAMALWALSRVVQYPRTERGIQERMRTAGIADQVLRKSPRHPGAARYYIQSVDDPVHADLGVVAADVFINAKPNSSEARHMPTHISAQLGRWKEMADLNWEAFEISMAWTKAHGYKLQDLNNHNYGHLLTYAQYGYLQLGQYDRAREIIDRVRGDYTASGKAPEIASTLAGTTAQYLVETGDPAALKALEDLVEKDGLKSPSVHYAIGLAAARAGDVARTKKALSMLGEGEGADAKIMRHELEALIAVGEGNLPKALALLKEASELNEGQIYTHFGPPGPYKPPHELYGETLLAAQKPAEALRAFEDGLRIHRGRTGLLKGVGAAKKAITS